MIAAGERTEYLEHCGSPRHRFLTINTENNGGYPSCWSGICPVPFSSHAVMWQPDALSNNLPLLESVSGYFLPSLRRFSLHFPDKVGVPGQFVLTARRLYVQAGGFESVWSAPIPTTPPPAKRPHKH